MIKFPDHKGALRLFHNDHVNMHQSPERWILEQEDGTNPWFEWISQEQRQKAIGTGSIWTLQWYPDTPVGFYAYAAADLEALLEYVNRDEDQIEAELALADLEAHSH